MTDSHAPATLYTFLIGEAYDDLWTAFVIDGRDYSNAVEMESDLDEADHFLRERRILSERQIAKIGTGAHRGDAPSWREWRERYVVRGEPLPVRSQPQKRRTPPGWTAMSEWLAGEHEWLRAQMVAAARAASPSEGPLIDRDLGPIRWSPGSVDPSEERYGVRVMMDIIVPHGDRFTAIRAAATLASEGWEIGDITEETSGSNSPPRREGTPLTC